MDLEVSRFSYVTYVRSNPEALWTLLTSAETTPKFWFDFRFETSWRQGAAWRLVYPEGRVADSGEILEIDPPRRMVLSWKNEFLPEMAEEGYSRLSLELTPLESVVRVALEHTIDHPSSKFIAAVGQGWPGILSSLKSLAETGQALPLTTL